MVKRTIDGKNGGNGNNPKGRKPSRTFQGCLLDSNSADKIMGKQLKRAIFEGDIFRMHEIFKGGVDVDARDEHGYTPLIFAAESGNLGVTGFLIDVGADVNATDNDGITALHKAILQSEVVGLLVKKGAKVNARDSEGWTPLMDACWIGNLESVKVLLENGADVNAKDNSGLTALVRAFARAYQQSYMFEVRREDTYSKIAELLIEYGAEVNARDRKGWTPLMDACWVGDLETVKVLLENGADVDAKDNSGLTALVRTFARAYQQSYMSPDTEEGEYHRIAGLLIEHGADVNFEY